MLICSLAFILSFYVLYDLMNKNGVLIIKQKKLKYRKAKFGLKNNCHNVNMNKNDTNVLLITEVIKLEGKKRVIQPQKYSGETSVVSMRMPKDMLSDLDKVASATGRTRNEILMLSIEFAFQYMEINTR